MSADAETTTPHPAGIGPEQVVTPADGLAVEAFPDALLIWQESRSRLHHLDTLAAIVFDELDGRAVSAVSLALATEFGAAPERVQADVLALLGTLRDEGLVTVR